MKELQKGCGYRRRKPESHYIWMPGTCLSSIFWASTLQNKAKIPIKNKGHLGSKYRGGLPLVAMSWDAIYVHVFLFFLSWMLVVKALI